MSLDLFQQESSDRLSAMAPVQNTEPATFDGFFRGTGMATMKGFAKTARAADLVGSLPAIVQDAFTGGTEAQDKYFKGHDAIFGSAVDYWTPKSNEIGSAAEVMGSLLSVLPQVMVSPSLAVAGTQLSTAEDLANIGVTTGKAQAVGAVQALTLGTGIWMPILGNNLWQRAVIGGAGFNLVQGAAARGVSGAIIGDDNKEAAAMFKALDPEAMTLDTLMGMAFGGLTHYSPTQRAQGTAAWAKMKDWAENLAPSDKAAIATLREAQHLNVDSTPGKPVGTPDIAAHVLRMRTAIDQMARGEPVNIEDIKVEGSRPEFQARKERWDTLQDQITEKTNSAQDLSGDAQAKVFDEIDALKAERDSIERQWGKAPGQVDKTAESPENPVDRFDVSQERREPRFEPDPERTAEAARTVEDLTAAAEVVRSEDGLPPPQDEPQRLVQSVRQTIEEQLLGAGRPAEEATAGAALWDAFYTTMAKRIGTTAADLWQRFPLAKITNEAPGGDALKQNSAGEPMLSVEGKLRPITDSTGRRIAGDIAELKNFWNWAKDTKVVDDQGKPLVVYHGTNADFSRFGKSTDGGYHFGTREAANARGEMFAGRGREGVNTVPVYLQIKNPLRVDDYGGDAESWQIAIQEAKKAGHDGLVYRNEWEGDGGKADSYVAFEPTQIKSAIGNKGTFDPKNPNILFQDKRDTWYSSALGTAIDKLNMKAGPAKGWLDALKGLGSKGVKADEIKWSGIEEWLKLQDGKVTKEQVQEFLANNGVKVEEVMLGAAPDGPSPESIRQTERLSAMDWGFDIDDHGNAVFSPLTEGHRLEDASMTVAELRRENMRDPTQVPQDVVDLATDIDQSLKFDQAERPTKFGTYQLPGGENYRELLLTLPGKSERLMYLPDHIKISKTERGWMTASPDGVHHSMVSFRDAETEAQARQVAANAFNVTQNEHINRRSDNPDFHSSHFEQPNILAHVRFNERTDADGKKVLFIEEFQSDWAQQGKKKGFEQLGRIEENADGSASVLNPDGSEAHFANSRQEAERWARENKSAGSVPAAPFVGKTEAWVGLALKRMITYAAQNGFERVAWTRGEQQVERYTGALRKAVDVIEWTKTDKGVQLVGYKGQRGTGEPSHADGTQLRGLREDADRVLRDYDNLDFNSVEEARQAILANEDWGTRWGDGMSPAEFNALSRYRRMYLGEKDGRTKVVDTTEKEDALSDAIGKAMADKIINDPNPSGIIEGDGIRIDSTGMAGFYDRIVPTVAKDVLKKLGGGKVGEVKTTIAAPVSESLDVVGPNGEVLLRTDYDSEAHAFARDNPGARVVSTPQSGHISEQPGFDITPAMKEKVDGGLPLFQKTSGTERGYMSIGPEGRVIGLLNADPSTFLHESGHFFLDTLAAIGRDEGAPPEVRADLDTALTWMGVKDPAKWADMTLAQKRPFHEKFARGFEQYLRDGEAPTPELKGIFQRFRDWLVEVYKSARSLNVKLNDDIRGVLNRMLADQTRNPSTEAPLAPADRAGSPPPPSEGGEAQVGAEAHVQTILQAMADHETGWAQEGGKLLDQGEIGTGKPSFTTWIPKAEWWPDRPDKKLNAAKVAEAVRKHLAGEKLKPGEQRTVDYMLQIAQDRARGIDQVGGEAEYTALADDAWEANLDATTENVVDLDLVARAAAIDEAYVERAAMRYEHDDAAFRGELEMLIHEHERAQATEAAGRSKAGEQAPGGKPGAGEKAQPQDIVKAEADLIVEKNPDMPITVGINPDGTPVTMTAREFLDQARAEAQMNRDDIPLLEVAAQCLLGVS